MEALVPATEYEVELLLTLLGRYAGPEVPDYVTPLTVKDDRLIFDLRWFVNLSYLSDFFIPLLPGIEEKTSALADRLWQMMIGKAPIPRAFVHELFVCIDTSQPTSTKLLKQFGEVVALLQKHQG